MTKSIHEYTEAREDSYVALLELIERTRLPYDFSKSIYKSDGEPMLVKCLFGHVMHIKPYELKSPYRDRVKKNLPACWECECAGVGAVELRHRVDTHYSSGKQIQVLSPYLGPNLPAEYLIDGKRHMMTPKTLKHHIASHPQKYRR